MEPADASTEGQNFAQEMRREGPKSVTPSLEAIGVDAHAHDVRLPASPDRQVGWCAGARSASCSPAVRAALQVATREAISARACLFDAPKDRDDASTLVRVIGTDCTAASAHEAALRSGVYPERVETDASCLSKPPPPPGSANQNRARIVEARLAARPLRRRGRCI